MSSMMKKPQRQPCPRPWAAREFLGDDGAVRHLCPVGANGYSALTVMDIGGTAFAAVYSDEDAHLMSAAPELLEALEAIKALYDSDEGCRSLPEYKAACAAIAKARGEGEIQERMAERVLAPNDGERKTLAERMRDKFHCAEITPEIVRKLKGEEKSVMDMIASSPDGKGSQEMHDALDVLHSYLLMCRLEDPVMAPRELLEELRAFTLEYDSGRAGVLRGGIDALLREEGEQ